MKRAHRRRHRFMWLVLGPAMIAGFVLALMVKTEVPVEPAAPIKTSSTSGEAR